MKQKVLFVGPAGFNPNSWKTRADYILPDLFASLGAVFELYLLTGPVPEFARDSMAALCRKFLVQHIEIPYPGKYGDQTERWRKMVEEVALSIRPSVITNSLGSLRLGEAISYGAAKSGARAVIRVAGDEIASRLAMGTYADDESRHKADLQLERAGFMTADTIIAMSPWERRRILDVLGNGAGKVKVCIRGADLSRFAPVSMGLSKRIARRFLYVGRKSAEKGYDIIESAAQMVFQTNPELEICFVGDFEPGRIENRNYLGWVEAANLPELYRSVDAFVLTSRTEGFPQVVAEALASGLPCIVSEHLFASILKHEEDALLTSLSPEDVAKQIIRLATDAQLVEQLSIRAREIAEQSLNQESWRKRYLDLLSGRSIEEYTVFDADSMPTANINQDVKIAVTKKRSSLRVLLIVPRALGLLGTPGSYNLAEALHRQAKLLVLCNQTGVGANNVPVVHNKEIDLPTIEINFRDKDFLQKILREVKTFQPDIVQLINWHGWVEVLPFLKKHYPSAKYIIDFKTPLMAEGDKREVLRQAGHMAAKYADLVASRNTEDIDTWIKDNPAPVLVYPLGVPVSALRVRTTDDAEVRYCHRFVYIGNFHEKRKLDVLLQLIAALPTELLEKFSLDLYGSGGDIEKLDNLIEQLGLRGRVCIYGALPQAELFPRLAEYDAGLAWVPRELYDAAPSIKFLEFAGSGLVVLATDTLAHKRNLGAGFEAILFAEDAVDFSEAIHSVMINGFSTGKIIRNLQRIKDFDWDQVVQGSFFPAYQQLITATSNKNCENVWATQIQQENAIDFDSNLRGSIAYERALHAHRMRFKANQLLES